MPSFFFFIFKMRKNYSEVASMDSPQVIFLFLLCILFTSRPVTSSSGPKISYTNHCAFMVPEAAPTTHMYTVYPFLEPQTSYYSGGEKFLGKNSMFGGAKSLYFAATTNIFMTKVDGLFKIEAHLIFQTPYNNFYALFNTTSDGGSRNYTRHHRSRRSIDFLLNGFWSVTSKKLCMVGSAPWYSSEGKSINLEAVLKLNFSRKLTLHTSLVNGVLESLASSTDDQSYFEPISILGFPKVTPHKYNYTLVSDDGCFGGNLPFNSSLRLNLSSICDMFSGQFITYSLRYPGSCNSASSSLNCTPFGPVSGNLPSLVSLYAIQCSRSERKLRYLVGFPKSRYAGYGSSFDPNTTLVGEGAWDARKNQLCLVLCRILNQDDLSGNVHPGDCSIRLTLRYRAVWSIRNRISVEGEIWTNKTANDVGYFEKIKFHSATVIADVVNLSGLKYEYTEMERVRKFCPVRKPLVKKGEIYPDGNSPGMRFDMYISKSKRFLGWGFADPISLGDQFYDSYMGVTGISSIAYAPVSGFVVPEADATVPVAVSVATHSSGPMNISYRISFSPSIGFKLGAGISSLNASLSPSDQEEISAEGVYDDRTGHLCMVGCRRLFPNESFDCEILVKMIFPPESGIKEGWFIKGSIESLRNKGDSLYFERLDISSNSITSPEARRNIWRMDLEIIMVLISNMLACVFVGLQIWHVKKQCDVLPFISLTMLLMLTLSHMIPLLLSFEALFPEHHARQNVMLGSGGWLEVNEVLVRVVTMVAFVLEFRLFQLAWAAKFSGVNEKGAWVTEIKTLFVLLPLYIIGGCIALLVNLKRNKYSTTTRFNQIVGLTQQHSSVWGNLRSYAGLVLDGFLFPQIVLNVFRISKGSALSPSFYVGTTFVRSLPHAYDLYRGQNHNYTGYQFDRFYIYANPRADFYSPSWDVVIACGGVLFVAIIAVQQHFGGRFFLPKKFRQSEEYEMVPVSTS